jgi:hypothetical protein
MIPPKGVIKMSVAQVAQLTVKEDLCRRILDLPESKFCRAVEFVDTIQDGTYDPDAAHEPNEETAKILRDSEAGFNLIGPFHDMEALMTSLLSDDDA